MTDNLRQNLLKPAFRILQDCVSGNDRRWLLRNGAHSHTLAQNIPKCVSLLLTFEFYFLSLACYGICKLQATLSRRPVRIEPLLSLPFILVAWLSASPEKERKEGRPLRCIHSRGEKLSF